MNEHDQRRLQRTIPLPPAYPNTASKSDARLGNGYLRGDMKVPLLDGTQATFEELEKRTAPFWVYSISAENQVVPGLARCVRTRENTALMRVIVSGGDEVICSPDHEFLLNGGNNRQARDLKFNDSLMALYRRWQTRDGYESVNNGKGSSRMTHVMVWQFFNGPVPDGHVVHHKNQIHFDNRPENLELMTVSQHSTHHRTVGHSFDNADPVFQRMRMAGIRRRADDPEQREKMVRVGIENITRYMFDHPEHFAESIKGNGTRGAPYLRKFNTSPRECGDCGATLKNPAALHWHRKKVHGYNHKVLLTQPVEESADVFGLQVDKHDNFALAAGVFVRNSCKNAVHLDPNRRLFCSEVRSRYSCDSLRHDAHYGQDIYVTRKGAVGARPGDRGIKPGRAMSRMEARRGFTMADQAAATQGIECRKAEAVIDEIQMAQGNRSMVVRATATTGTFWKKP